MESECHSVLEAFQQSRAWAAPSVAQTDSVLSRIVQDLRPPAQEWQARNAVIGRLQSVLTWMPDFQAVPGRYGDAENCLARILVFGSFCTTLYHKGSDLDLTITGHWRDRHGQLLDMHIMCPADAADMLHRIKRALVSRRVASDGSATVINTRVPLVMYTDAESGVQVDISVCNHSGVFKCRFIKMMTQFDDRFEALYRLVKLWAECKNLNDPKTGTLNSWSLTQMVVFHLQNCKPAILPPLWLFFHNEPQYGPRPLEQQQTQPDSDNVKVRIQQQLGNRRKAPYDLLPQCDQQRQRYQSMYNRNSGSNRQGITELLAGFFVRYHEVFKQWVSYQRYRDTRMSTWLGRWDQGGSSWRHEYLVCMEDPFDSSDNTARTLGTQSRNDGGSLRILRELQQASKAISSLQTQQDIYELVTLLFHSALKDGILQGPNCTVALPQQLEGQGSRQQQQQPVYKQPEAHVSMLQQQMQHMNLKPSEHLQLQMPLSQLQQPHQQLLQQLQQQQQQDHLAHTVHNADPESADQYTRARALVAAALTNLHRRQPTVHAADLAS